MIIFDLDGTLANCEHRRHFVDPDKHPDFNIGGVFAYDNKGRKCDQIGQPFKPDWKSFYEACDKDAPIKPVIETLQHLLRTRCFNEIQIWSARCESVREQTEHWLKKNYIQPILLTKMRPIGDSTPDDELKESWLNERCADLIDAQIEHRNPIKHDIEFVFDDRPKVVRMWRRRGIFVFNCCQHVEEF